MGAMAQFERDIMRESTNARSSAAKQGGKRVGRPRALSEGRVHHMDELLGQG